MSKLINKFDCHNQNNENCIILLNCNMAYILGGGGSLGHGPYINLALLAVHILSGL